MERRRVRRWTIEDARSNQDWSPPDGAGYQLFGSDLVSRATDPEAAMVVGFAAMPSGERLRAAFPYDEMVIVLGGVLRVRTEDDGELVVHPGEVVHLPANSTNEFVAEEEVTACYVAGPPDVYARHADDPASHRWEPQPASTGTGTPDEAAVRRALHSDVLVDITTVGRRSGLPRRLEIWLYRSGGRFFLTGYPEDRPRDWYRNLLADPRLTLHLKESVVVDLPATAVEVTDVVDRRRVLDDVLDQLSRPDNPQGLSEELDRAGWHARSPLLEIIGLTG